MIGCRSRTRGDEKTFEMATIIKPPTPLPAALEQRVLFLAGSIDLGAAPDWQRALASSLLDIPSLVILDPRRDAWDSSWAQSKDDLNLRGQVEWELDGLERANVIAYYFAPGSKAPVTMIELGLHARSGKAVVCCPEGFWRKGNVDIVCERYGVEQVASLDALETAVRRRFGDATLNRSSAPVP
jgi:hypothetical protein